MAETQDDLHKRLPNTRDIRNAYGYEGGRVGGYPGQSDDEYMTHELKGMIKASQPSSPSQYDSSTKTKEPPAPTGPSSAKPNNYDNGGKVLKTGLALVHKGEEVKPVKHNVSLYRAMHHLNKGGLHRALGVPEGSPIPKEKLSAAKNSKNEHIAKMAHFADTMSHFKH